MRGDEGLLLALRARSDMPSMKWWRVALDMGQAEQRHQREILLHADAGQVVRSSADMK